MWCAGFDFVPDGGTTSSRVLGITVRSALNLVGQVDFLPLAGFVGRVGQLISPEEVHHLNQLRTLPCTTTHGEVLPSGPGLS